MPAALVPEVIDQPEERSSRPDDIARPVTLLSRPPSPTAAPLMGPADPGVITPLMGPVDPGIVTPLMGPADLRTGLSVMGPADPGIVTPLMGPADLGVTPVMCPAR